ncbi:MAG: type II toxin-antitoxin system RelE/ParE family toxin [Roseiarcus sp.]
MHAYLTRSFDRDAKRDGVSDEDCQEAIRKAERGLVDADLGSGLIKQRIPRGNQGAARGSRAVVFKAAHVFEKLNESELLALQAAKGWRLIEI